MYITLYREKENKQKPWDDSNGAESKNEVKPYGINNTPLDSVMVAGE